MNMTFTSSNPRLIEAKEALERGMDANEILLAEKDAFELLPCRQSTLRKSRLTGELLGHPAPVFVRMGKMIRYRLQDILDWKERSTGPSYHSTAEFSASRVVNS